MKMPGVCERVGCRGSNAWNIRSEVFLESFVLLVKFFNSYNYKR